MKGRLKTLLEDAAGREFSADAEAGFSTDVRAARVMRRAGKLGIVDRELGYDDARLALARTGKSVLCSTVTPARLSTRPSWSG